MDQIDINEFTEKLKSLSAEERHEIVFNLCKAVGDTAVWINGNKDKIWEQETKNK